MATFAMEIPDDQVSLVIESFIQQYNMEGADTADDAAKTEFARQKVMTYINEIVRGHLAWQHDQAKPVVPDNPVDLT